VILNHIAQGAGAIIIFPAVPDSQLFGHRNLDVVDEQPVPERFEIGVGEPEGQDILNGFLAEVVINAENLRFFELSGENAVQFAG
jgi:hypothetical protein